MHINEHISTLNYSHIHIFNCLYFVFLSVHIYFLYYWFTVFIMFVAIHFAAATLKISHCGTNKGLSCLLFEKA